LIAALIIQAMACNNVTAKEYAMNETATTSSEVTLSFNPMSAEFKRDPYPYYERLRREAPVHRSDFGFWSVALYEDVAYVLKSPQVFSSAGMGGPTMAQSMGGGQPVRSIITSDPPQHTLIRNTVNRAFTPRMVADMEPRIRHIARELLDAAMASGELDVVRDLATPLPVTVIAEILGVDPARREDFKRWSNAIVNGFGDGTPGGAQRVQEDRAEFFEYMQEQVALRRSAPKGDLISAIVAAEEAEVAFTPEEVAAFAMLLLVAGNETTTNLIGNAMLALLSHPDQLAAVASEPGTIPNMIEEALRYDSPVQYLFRQTTQETEIRGTVIPANNVVVPIYASANRDDAKYPDAARFDVTRDTQGHLAFGLGPHFCLGAPLARLEARVAFEELFVRTRNLRSNGSEPKRIDSMFLRGLGSLPIAFDAA
jgi:cytochrome P450